MEIRHLRYFIGIAEAGGFARAANRLNVTQSALSKQIRDLETDLEVTLFDRTRRSIRLTDAGQRFLEDAQKLLEFLEEARTRARMVHRGKLGALEIGVTYASSWNLVFTQFIRAFRQQNPDVTLRIQVMGSPKQLVALRNGRLSAGFIVELPPEEEEFDALEVFTDPVVLAVLNTSHFVQHPPKRLAELAQENLFVIPRKINPVFHDRLVRICHNSGLGPRLTKEGLNHVANLSLVAAGLGCALVPYEFRHWKPENVTLVPVGDLKMKMHLACVWRRDNQQPILKNFIQTLRANIGNHCCPN